MGIDIDVGMDVDVDMDTDPWSLVLVLGPCSLVPGLWLVSWCLVPGTGSWSLSLVLGPGPVSLVPGPWSDIDLDIDMESDMDINGDQ